MRYFVEVTEQIGAKRAIAAFHIVTTDSDVEAARIAIDREMRHRNQYDIVPMQHPSASADLVDAA